MGKILYAAIGIGAAVTALTLAAYSVNEPDMVNLESNNEKIKVYASFFPYFEFTKNIAGDRAQTLQFIPEGVQAHGWTPSVKMIQSLEKTDVFVHSGLGIESYISQMTDSGEFDHITFIKASDGIDLLKPRGNNDLSFDPHIWLDPILVKKQVDNIKTELIKADPAHGQYYEENAKTYKIKLDKLDEKIKSSLSACDKNKIMTFHDAFTYFAQRYDLDVYTLGGLEHESEFSASEIAEFIDYAVDNDIKVIFAEELVDSRLADVIATEAGAKILLFNPLEALPPLDAANGLTFLDKMEQNLQALEVALECQ